MVRSLLIAATVDERQHFVMVEFVVSVVPSKKNLDHDHLPLLLLHQ